MAPKKSTSDPSPPASQADISKLEALETKTTLDKTSRSKWSKKDMKTYIKALEVLAAPDFPETDAEGGAPGSDSGKVLQDSKMKDIKNNTDTIAKSLEVRVHAPKVQFNGDQVFSEFRRSIAIWRRQLIRSDRELTEEEDAILGTVVVEAIKGPALRTVYDRIDEGLETLTKVMGALQQAYGRGVLPETLTHFRKYQAFERAPETKLRDFINEYLNIRSKCLSTGNKVDGLTEGMVLLEKAKLSSVNHAAVMRHVQSTPGAMESGFPVYDSIMEQLILFADSYGAHEARTGKGPGPFHPTWNKGKGKGAKVFFSYDAVGDEWYKSEKDAKDEKQAYTSTHDQGQQYQQGGGKYGGKYGGKAGGKTGGKGAGKGKYGKPTGKGAGKGGGKYGKPPGKGGGKSGGKYGNGEKTGVCWDYQAGNCTRGKSCRFEHAAAGGQKSERAAAGGKKRERAETVIPDDSDSDAPPVRKKKKGN